MEMEQAEKYLYFDNDDESIKEFEIVKRFKSHNILKERIDLYKDFTINLLIKIYDSYLGKEYIKNRRDIEGHYNWCFGKVLEEFDDQEIDFYGNDELYNYFFSYFLDQFYNTKKQLPLNSHKRMWINIFNHKNSNKDKSEFEVLVELYQIFDASLDTKHFEVYQNKS